MIKVYITDKKINLLFNENPKESTYDIGVNLMKYLWLPINEIRDELYKYCTAYSQEKYNFENEKKYNLEKDKISLMKLNPYLFFYIEGLNQLLSDLPIYKNGVFEFSFGINFFMESLTDFNIQKSAFEISQSYQNDLDIVISYCKKIHRTPQDIKDVIISAINIVLYDIELKKQRIYNEVNFIKDIYDDSLFNDFSCIEKLIYYNKKRCFHFFHNDKETISYLILPNISILGTTKEEIISSIKSQKCSYVYAHVIKNLDDLVQFELHQILKQDVYINKCAFCGNFFIPQSRIDTKYCNMISQTKPIPCSKSGAKKIYDQKVGNNAIIQAYKKAYNRMMSRYRRKKISQSNLGKWIESATNMRNKCIEKKITLEELNKFLGNI